MNRKYWHGVFVSKGMPPKSNVIFYKNPNECNCYFFERVNPNHIGIVWGHRKLTGNWIQVAKVYIHANAFISLGFFGLMPDIVFGAWMGVCLAFVTHFISSCKIVNVVEAVPCGNS